MTSSLQRQYHGHLRQACRTAILYDTLQLPTTVSGSCLNQSTNKHQALDPSIDTKPLVRQNLPQPPTPKHELKPDDPKSLAPQLLHARSKASKHTTAQRQILHVWTPLNHASHGQQDGRLPYFFPHRFGPKKQIIKYSYPSA